MSEINYSELAKAIALELRALPSQDKIIWTAKQCAEYLGVSERHFVDRLSKSFGFPTPIKLPSDTGARGHSRWYEVELTAWVRKQKIAS
jgi:predicted DNA-binding transcriptional regulator AlpA